MYRGQIWSRGKMLFITGIEIHANLKKMSQGMFFLFLFSGRFHECETVWLIEYLVDTADKPSGPGVF